jgi:hypothetical protein
MVFAVQDAGFYPRSALEYDDAAQNRLEKILSLIEECRFGIHDLSRTEPSREGLPRFNMPLELGLFLGCKRFGGEPHSRKACLVLDRERYRFQRFISDIAGQDIHAHGGDPRKAVREVSGWLRNNFTKAAGSGRCCDLAQVRAIHGRTPGAVSRAGDRRGGTHLRGPFTADR